MLSDRTRRIRRGRIGVGISVLPPADRAAGRRLRRNGGLCVRPRTFTCSRSTRGALSRPASHARTMLASAWASSLGAAVGGAPRHQRASTRFRARPRNGVRLPGFNLDLPADASRSRRRTLMAASNNCGRRAWNRRPVREFSCRGAGMMRVCVAGARHRSAALFAAHLARVGTVSVLTRREDMPAR